MEKEEKKEKKKKKREKVIVVGAGPVGSLAALYAANRGNDVEVYELRGGKLRNNRQSFIAFSTMLNGTRTFDCFANKRFPYFRDWRFLQACSTCLIGFEVTKILRSIRRDTININSRSY
jgi:2-polyprenyl-6-methoxyphenol hydroxylase-like FAD-dependent oxidoreductase